MPERARDNLLLCHCQSNYCRCCIELFASAYGQNLDCTDTVSAGHAGASLRIICCFFKKSGPAQAQQLSDAECSAAHAYQQHMRAATPTAARCVKTQSGLLGWVLVELHMFLVLLSYYLGIRRLLWLRVTGMTHTRGA
jgi:hypothetical protein